MASTVPAATLVVTVLWFTLASSGLNAQTLETNTPAAGSTNSRTVNSLALPTWPQSKSDLVADPDIRFGTLPNGMRYAIRKQSARPGQAAFRFRIKAGSLMESDSQQGLAHFLEHMAFKGSKAYPDGEILKVLERLGLSFGADTNATTDFDQTIYKLDLPRTDEDTVESTLTLLREAASNLTLDATAMDSERGVVLSEERARDTPYFRLFGSRLRFQLKDQKPSVRFPIGKVEVLKTAPITEISDYYRKYYRPERAVLIAVGDFDPSKMEAKIQAKFGDWTPSGPPGPDPQVGKVKARKLEAKIFVDPGVATSISIAWIRPPDLRLDTVATRRDDLYGQLAFAILNRRLQTIARSGDSPFLSSGAFSATEYDAATTTYLVVNAAADNWKPALARAEVERRRLLQFGVRQEELDREIVEMRTGLQAIKASAATVVPSEMADGFVGATGDDSVITSPAQDLDYFEAAVKDLKADTIWASFKRRFRGEGPLIFIGSPKPIAGGEDAVIAAFKEAQKQKLEPGASTTTQAWPYRSFGSPSDIVETTEVPDLDLTFVRFANGVQLTIKSTKFQENKVLVRLNMGRGRAGLPGDAPSLGWATGALTGGGLGKLTSTELEQVLANRVFAARFGITDDAFVLMGETTRSDLDIQLQLLAAYVADPGWRPETFERLKTAAKPMNDQFEATDSGVLSRDLPGLVHNGDPRWAFPKPHEIEGADFAQFKALISPILAKSPLEVIIVGDITPEKAVELVAQTFGALPQRDPLPNQMAETPITFPKATPTPIRLTHKGRDDQSIALVAWPVRTYFDDPRGDRAVDILSEIIKLRLRAELRESQGATYAPNTSLQTSLTWPDWGYLAARVEVPLLRLDSSLSAIKKIAADLAKAPPTQDELVRAKTPRLDDFAKARETNAYWIAELGRAQSDPRRLTILRGAIPATEKVTAEDVQRAAQAILGDGSAWTLTIAPQAPINQKK